MILLAILFVLSVVPAKAAQPPLESVRIGIPGKLVDFAPFFVGIKTGIYRSEGLEPQFIVMRSGIIIPALLSGELDYTTIYGSTIRSLLQQIHPNILLGKKVSRILVMLPNVYRPFAINNKLTPKLRPHPPFARHNFLNFCFYCRHDSPSNPPASAPYLGDKDTRLFFLDFGRSTASTLIMTFIIQQNS
jgi:hypothetical protein